MVFFEGLKALLELDIAFFIGIIQNNLLWVFAFLFVNHVIFKGKHLLPNFALFSVFIWAFREFGHIWGLQGFGANAFFFFAFITLMRFFVLDPKTFGRHTGIADVAGFYGFIFVLNFFLV